jgi:NAD(P)-dependent dehydrogenase (short-subunit alcohol dehydrogenase family)
MAIRFDEQVAIVTGAGRGLGRAHAIELAKRGATVVVNDPGLTLRGDAKEGAPADEVVALIAANGGTAVADHGDVSVAADADALVARTIERFGRIDILINNAGNIRHLKFTETSADDLMSHLTIHVLGSFRVSRAAWPHMLARNYGRIVLTTSQVGLYGQIDAAAYGAAKMGIIGLMHGMKLEAAGTGITVNCISPFALTRMAPGAFPREMADFMTPDLVAPAVAYLASEQCALNGEILIAGGAHFATARSVETRGIDFDNPAAITAEIIAERLPEIADRDGAKCVFVEMGAVGITFERIGRLAGA